MQRKVLAFGLLLLCSLAFVASSVEAGVLEKWEMVQRVRWTSNKGDRGTEVYEGELWVAVSSDIASNISSQASAFLWNGLFTATNQPWRDNTIRANHLVFEALTPAGDVLVGRLRPNRQWTRLTGKIVGSVASGVDPSLSYYYEITVRATPLF